MAHHHFNLNMIRDWKQEIAVAWLVKQAMMELDTKKLFPYHLPNVAATHDEIATAELAIGYELDTSYKEFLKCANGWSGFWHSADLFGISDLIGGARKENAEFLLSMIDESVLNKSGMKRSELLAIAATADDKDLFVMASPASSAPGIVLWYAGEEIERFKNFENYFLAMVEYCRKDVLRFKKSEREIKITRDQKKICAEFGAAFSPLPGNAKIGIARNVKDGLKPINGLRHPPEGDTSGWYIWAGEALPDDPDFFVALHADHLFDWCPQALKFLGLPPGWRFLTDGIHEDVWEDKSLLHPDKNN